MVPAVKRLLRIGLWVLAGVVVLVVVAAILCLGGVDSRPYFRESYYTRTVAQLGAEVQTNKLAHGELEAGFGRARLTPTVNAPQDGPARRRPSS